MYPIAMLSKRDRNLRVSAAVALAAGILALYLSTLPPTLTWGWDNKGSDGGEFLAAAETLGVPHPPGYPTYTLLLKGFDTVVPLGDFAFRGNLLSAILASASVIAVYWVTLRLCRTMAPEAPEWFAVVAAALGSAALATSPLFWSQALITEVYALNAFFAGCLLLIAADVALSPRVESGRFKLALFGLLLGVGLGNHLTLLAVAVPLLGWVWSAAGWRKVASPWTVAPFVLGISIYAYLPISASQGPPINWGNADTVGGIVWMLTARPYQEYVFGVATNSIPDRLVEWTDLAFSQFNPLGLFFGLVATAPLLRLARGFFLSSLASILMISVYATMYNSVDFEVLMIPAFLLFSVWLGFGFFWIMATWIRDFRGEWNLFARWRFQVSVADQAVVLGLLGFLLLPAVSVALNYGPQNLRGDRTARDHARALIGAVPDGSVVLSTRERNVFSLWYTRYVEQPERDVAIIAVPLLQFDWYLDNIRALFPERIPAVSATDTSETLGRIVEHNDGRAGVYFTYTSRSLQNDFNLTAVGRLYEARPKPEP